MVYLEKLKNLKKTTTRKNHLILLQFHERSTFLLKWHKAPNRKRQRITHTIIIFYKIKRTLKLDISFVLFSNWHP